MRCYHSRIHLDPLVGSPVHLPVQWSCGLDARYMSVFACFGLCRMHAQSKVNPSDFAVDDSSGEQKRQKLSAPDVRRLDVKWMIMNDYIIIYNEYDNAWYIYIYIIFKKGINIGISLATRCIEFLHFSIWFVRLLFSISCDFSQAMSWFCFASPSAALWSIQGTGSFCHVLNLGNFKNWGKES